MKTKALSILGRPLMVACVSAAMYSAHVAPAQEPDSPAKDKNESADNANKRKLAVMRKLAEAIHVKTGEGEASNQAKLIPEPLFRFSDQARLLPDGSVWGWGTAGRPVMMVEFRTYDRTPGEWGYDLTATSDVQFSADVTGHGRWAPRKSDFKLLPAGDIAPPAKTEAARLRQMKQFARSLNASELWKGQRSELRLLPTEVHRYSDAASGIVDGAAFIIVVGSNPEAILLVEAHRAESNPSAPGTWKYGLARMSAAEMTFRLGDSEVWKVPEDHGGPAASYYSFWRADAVPAPAPRDLK
ncbi:MAG TPA: hypothetical protein VJ809_10275 [Pirellulales bacterium]|nr:hypothetical protein [Pirellulales bacterium]